MTDLKSMLPEELCEYMTNDNPFDDVNYFLNKTIIYGDTLKMVLNTLLNKLLEI